MYGWWYIYLFLVWRAHRCGNFRKSRLSDGLLVYYTSDRLPISRNPHDHDFFELALRDLLWACGAYSGTHYGEHGGDQGSLVSWFDIATRMRVTIVWRVTAMLLPEYTPPISTSLLSACWVFLKFAPLNLISQLSRSESPRFVQSQELGSSVLVLFLGGRQK